MDCEITNMSDQRENMAQEVKILENTAEETLKWREVSQYSPWIVKDIKDVDTKLTRNVENPSPTASRITQDLFVDNVLTSFTAEDDLMQFYRDSRCLLQKGGFNLRSWNSNSNRLRELAETENVLDSSNEVNILGMRWNVADDKLLFAEVDIDSTMVDVTKREILRQSSKIFDPLGILSPVTVKAKILMQSLWKLNFGWDERLPEDVTTQWTTLSTDLKDTKSVEFTRLLNNDGLSPQTARLHIFTDANKQAYGACAYIVQGKHSQLVMAKNRVAPLKVITLPRLELMGAVVGAKLAKHVSNILGITEITFWCDSQIVLSWLYSSKIQKPFIANRITPPTGPRKYSPFP
ncbi:uncharacterized protein [Mytilus edulis]|uniref:uncharacterized protein n=1 Tax=Mytilus edulis TaxID=6550 RepID=UPI0039EFC84D